MNNPSLKRISRLNYGIGGVLIIGAAITQPREISLGILVGVVLTCINFAVLSALVRKWTSEAAKGMPMRSGMLVLPKMLGLMIAVIGSLELLPIDAGAFAIGFSTFILSIMIEAVYSAFAHSDGDASNGASTDG
jgi:uncharacterized membrane protein (DUF485 family)